MPESKDALREVTFEPANATGASSTYLFLGGAGLLAVAIVGFVTALATRHTNQLGLHVTTTLPTILAVGLLARGFSVRNLPQRIVVGPGGLEITTHQGTKQYAWSEIGAASTAQVLNSHKTCLRITNATGKAIVSVDESLPQFPALVQLVQSYIDAKPDDTSLRIMQRKAKLMGMGCLIFGILMGMGAIFIGFKTYTDQRSQALLQSQGVPGTAEIVRRFVAPNGVTKRLEYRVAGAASRNVEVESTLWDQLEHETSVPVLVVPDEPSLSQLAVGEIRDEDFTKTPQGGYLLAGLGGLIALFFLGFTPFAWMGYDLAYDEKQSTWKVKRYGRVIWASKQAADGAEPV